MSTKTKAAERLPREGPARIEQIKVTNYRALKSIELADLTPLTVLLGPNGSGKSTVFDVLNFLSECFRSGLRPAWDRRGRARELRTRGQQGPVTIELKYRDSKARLMTYHLAVDEERGRVFVAKEWLRWTRGPRAGRPFNFLDYERGQGSAIPGEEPDAKAKRVNTPLRSPDLIAVSTLGQFEQHPRVASLREFIADWYVSYLSVDETRVQPEAGPQERLSKTGGNIANVVQFLKEQHPDRLDRIFEQLRRRVPRIEKVIAEPMADGRLLMEIKDAPFDQPILARFASDGTLKLLAYLIILNDPRPPQFIGIEEPENFLHPRLLPELAEECRAATDRSQLLVTTHSPFFLNGLRAEEVRVLYRDDEGFTQAIRASDVRGIPQFIAAGASLGQLWMEGHLGAGDPLVRSGAPESKRKP